MSADKSSPNRPSPDPTSGRRHSGHAQLDHILDPYKRAGKLAEPTLCAQCGAVYKAGRWQWLPRPDKAETTLCQACQRINDRFPAGTVTLSGKLVAAHKDEMIRLAQHQEQAEKAEHPLNRLMGIAEEAPDRLVISTTDIHLPRRIGTAIKRAYHGELSEHFDENGYFVRINWHRDA